MLHKDFSHLAHFTKVVKFQIARSRTYMNIDCICRVPRHMVWRHRSRGVTTPVTQLESHKEYIWGLQQGFMYAIPVPIILSISTTLLVESVDEVLHGMLYILQNCAVLCSTLITWETVLKLWATRESEGGTRVPICREAFWLVRSTKHGVWSLVIRKMSCSINT